MADRRTRVKHFAADSGDELAQQIEDFLAVAFTSRFEFVALSYAPSPFVGGEMALLVYREMP